ncbi:MAG: hypothetical protein R6W06_12990 [Prochlorococcaceae cyanobacterium]
MNLQRRPLDCTLNIGLRRIDILPQPHEPQGYAKEIELNITVHSDGHNELLDVLESFEGMIKRQSHQLADPRQLPIAARNSLIQSKDEIADITLYLEDDLVISDRLYLDKQLWFLNRTNHSMVLMPHRYEQIHNSKIGVMLVDGPLSPKFINRFTTPQRDIAKGSFLGREAVSFDISENPHSGSFAFSRQQVEKLRTMELPNEGFVGPLETAATFTALKYFPIAKPAWQNRNFLMIEHGHPSFQGYLGKLPRIEQQEA